jgi:hypothetical protein
MMEVAEVTVGSQINTKHINMVWQGIQLLDVKLLSASHNM